MIATVQRMLSVLIEKRLLYGISIVFAGVITLAVLGPATHAKPSDPSVPVQKALSQSGFDENSLGLAVDDVSRQLQKRFKISDKSGVVVINVTPDSPADAGGMHTGDLIKKIDRRPIRNIEDFKTAMGYWKRDRSIEFLVKRGRKTLTIVIGIARKRIRGS